MNTNTTDELNAKQPSQQSEIYRLEFARKLWSSRKLILKACCIGAAMGIVITFSIPKEYTASTLVAPEGYRRSPSSGISALADMADIDIRSSSTDERDAIYPSLYPRIVNSTPFLVPLFDIPVIRQKDSTAIPLAQYLKENQQRPWWSIVASAPFRLVSWTISLFRSTSDKDNETRNSKTGTDLFHLTREKAGLAGTIASRIKIGVDKKKKTLTISVTMQDPLVAATVADTVCARLKEYITEYRTAKARHNLKYVENLCKEAQEKYYDAQEKYTRYADANRGLVKLTPRAELVRLQNEMNLSFTIYNQLERQVQAAKAKVEKTKPVYAVIRPVQVPLSPSKPRTLMIFIVCVFLSATGSISWVLFGRNFMKNLKK